jgi:hypothetical protein
MHGGNEPRESRPWASPSNDRRWREGQPLSRGCAARSGPGREPGVHHNESGWRDAPASAALELGLLPVVGQQRGGLVDVRRRAIGGLGRPRRRACRRLCGCGVCRGGLGPGRAAPQCGGRPRPSGSQCPAKSSRRWVRAHGRTARPARVAWRTRPPTRPTPRAPCRPDRGCWVTRPDGPSRRPLGAGVAHRHAILATQELVGERAEMDHRPTPMLRPGRRPAWGGVEIPCAARWCSTTTGG